MPAGPTAAPHQPPALVLRRSLLLGALGLVVTAAAALGVAWYLRGHYWLPKQYLEAAERALDQRDFDEARRQLALSLEARPDDPRLHFLMARAARRARKLDEAESHLARCEHLQGDKPDPEVGDTKLEWALVAVQRGKLLKTEPFLRRCLRQQHPDLVLILETLSWELMRRNRLQDAAALLELWVEKQPDDYEALVRHGWVAEHVFDVPRAIADYRKALTLQPDRDSVRLRVAELLLNQNQAPGALADVEELRRRDPGNPDVILCAARCLRLLGRMPEAQHVLDQFLAANPRHAGALALRAQLALEAGRTQEAERLLRQAAALEPLNRQVNYALMQCLKQLGKTAEIKAVEARVAEADAELKRMDQLVREVMQRPYDPSLRYEVGMIFLRNGMAREGLHWLSTALEADPTHRPTHEALAEHYERTGDRQRAALHRQLVGERPSP
jgi:predicted Zn-dependent protease